MCMGLVKEKEIWRKRDQERERKVNMTERMIDWQTN